MHFQDFEVEISADDDYGYTVAVIHSPAGEARGAFELPFSSLELEKYILELQNALLRSGGPPRRRLSQAEETVQDFGRVLFDTLFPADIRTLYYQSRDEAKRHEAGLRLKLRIQSPELAALPWEFLYDPRRREYVCLSRNTPIVRYLNLPRSVPPLAITAPLRILGMVASPNDQEALDVALEQERLRRALQRLDDQGLVTLDWLEGQSWRDLQDVLYQQQYHVFHFIGHGYFNDTEEEGVVLFANRQGRSEPFGATKLARLLADHSSLRLAVLNSCEGAKAGQYDVFSSTAATLVRRGIPAVIAMQYDITDDAAITMAERFYHALGSGLPVDAALTEARKSISFAVQNSLEWGTPVLFMRATDGRLFETDKQVQTDARETIASATHHTKPETVEPLPSPAKVSPPMPDPSPLDIDKPVRTNAEETILSTAQRAGLEPVKAPPSPVHVNPSEIDSKTPYRIGPRWDSNRATDTPNSKVLQGEGRKWGRTLRSLFAVAIVLALGYWAYGRFDGGLNPPSVIDISRETEATAETEASAGMVREMGGIPFVYVPAGEFEMGSEDGPDDEQPVHMVYLDSYWIMQTEVTNAQYAKCVTAGTCQEPRNDLWNTEAYGNHPVTDANWDDAVTYAAWLTDQTGQTMRLPTEAEWEKSARGNDGHTYPWGSSLPEGNLLNYRRNEGGTTPVGSYPDGASPYRALDMAGNVWEWTADWYDSDYYANSPERNPSGPESGELRVARGGSWISILDAVRASNRRKISSVYEFNYLGFRLATDLP